MIDPQATNPNPAPRKRGRKRLDPAGGATIKYTLRITPELAQAMKRSGIKAADIRHLIANAVMENPPEEPTP